VPIEHSYRSGSPLEAATPRSRLVQTPPRLADGSLGFRCSGRPRAAEWPPIARDSQYQRAVRVMTPSRTRFPATVTRVRLPPSGTMANCAVAGSVPRLAGYIPRLGREDRKQVVAELRQAGLSTRAIGEALGISHEQARQDAAGVKNLTPEQVTGTDGKQYPASRLSRPRRQSFRCRSRSGRASVPRCATRPATGPLGDRIADP